MRYLLFIGVLMVLATPVAQAQENINETKDEKTQKTYLDTNNGGLACGIAGGNYQKAAYKEPEPQKFTINASAYTAAADECGKSDGITASGNKVKENRTLACPKEYKFGTKIHIEGMGTYICEDRGGAIKNNRFDIYMETKSEAFAFGRQQFEAYVVI
ncbi:MAG: 3D domain-containing protein [Parcubacteria group bacterium]